MPFGEGVANIGEVGGSVDGGGVPGVMQLHVEARPYGMEWHAEAVGCGGEDACGVGTAVEEVDNHVSYAPRIRRSGGDGSREWWWCRVPVLS